MFGKIMVFTGIFIFICGIFITAEIFNKNFMYSKKEKFYRTLGISIVIFGALLQLIGFYKDIYK